MALAGEVEARVEPEAVPPGAAIIAVATAV